MTTRTRKIAADKKRYFEEGPGAEQEEHQEEQPTPPVASTSTARPAGTGTRKEKRKARHEAATKKAAVSVTPQPPSSSSAMIPPTLTAAQKRKQNKHKRLAFVAYNGPQGGFTPVGPASTTSNQTSGPSLEPQPQARQPLPPQEVALENSKKPKVNRGVYFKPKLMKKFANADIYAPAEESASSVPVKKVPLAEVKDALWEKAQEFWTSPDSRDNPPHLPPTTDDESTTSPAVTIAPATSLIPAPPAPSPPRPLTPPPPKRTFPAPAPSKPALPPPPKPSLPSSVSTKPQSTPVFRSPIFRSRASVAKTPRAISEDERESSAATATPPPSVAPATYSPFPRSSPPPFKSIVIPPSPVAAGSAFQHPTYGSQPTPHPPSKDPQRQPPAAKETHKEKEKEVIDTSPSYSTQTSPSGSLSSLDIPTGPRKKIKLARTTPLPPLSPLYLKTSLIPSFFSSDANPSTPLLVLDLNNTLLYRRRAGFDGSQNPLPRPYLTTFLNYLTSKPKKWTLAVYSSAKTANVIHMLKYINMVPREKANRLKKGQAWKSEDGEILKLVWARENMRLDELEFVENVETVKDLKDVWENLGVGEELGAKTTVLLDDDLLKAQLQPYNHLPITYYEPTLTSTNPRIERPDYSLLSTIYLLEILRQQSNISSFIRSEGLKDYQALGEEELIKRGKNVCEDLGLELIESWTEVEDVLEIETEPVVVMKKKEKEKEKRVERDTVGSTLGVNRHWNVEW